MFNWRAKPAGDSINHKRLETLLGREGKPVQNKLRGKMNSATDHDEFNVFNGELSDPIRSIYACVPNGDDVCHA